MKKNTKTKKKQPKAQPSANIPPDEMRSWDDDSDRVEGLKDFLAMIRLNPREVIPCKTIPGHARNLFALWGHFYLPGQEQGGKVPIPATTVFSVYDRNDIDRPRRDEQVVLILDTPGEPYENDTYTPFWRCTYSPYETRIVAKRKGKSRWP